MKYQEVKKIVDDADHIVVLQADNPDGDSLGSSLALEAILLDMGKKVTLVCAIDMPAHLKHLNGWDRVQKDIPQQFDATIIVDTSTETLFENANGSINFGWMKAKPVIVLDHHVTSKGLSFATVSIVEPVVATSELIHMIATELGWPLPIDACEMMAMSILSDSLGLMTQATTPESFRVMADLVERGVDLPKLDAARRELMKKEPMLLAYKGELLQRVVFDVDGKLATVTIPWNEIEKYSPIYNPTMLVMDDLRMTIGVEIVIGYKVYNDGKITAKIRSNYGIPIADSLAQKFGGGGHPYAAGFKILDGTPIDQLKRDVAKITQELLQENEDKS